VECPLIAATAILALVSETLDSRQIGVAAIGRRSRRIADGIRSLWLNASLWVRRWLGDDA